MLCPKCGAKNPSLTSKCLSCRGPLPISGPLTEPTAIMSNTCTASTSGMGNLSRMPPVSIASRIPGVIVLVAAALVLVGIFLPWLDGGGSFGDVPGFGEWTYNVKVSGWDMATGHGLTNEQWASHVEKYAVLTIIGGILIVIGASWALVTPLMRFAWVPAIVGGILAVVGCAWGWSDLNDFVAAGANSPGISIGYGAGWYMGMLGGVVGSITGVYAFRRSADTSY